VLGGRIVASRQKHVESRDYLVEGSSPNPALRNSTDLNSCDASLSDTSNQPFQLCARYVFGCIYAGLRHSRGHSYMLSSDPSGARRAIGSLREDRTQ